LKNLTQLSVYILLTTALSAAHSNNSMTDTQDQTISPMDDLRQASAEVSGISVLSTAAQAVLDAAVAVNDLVCTDSIAAALRAAAVHSYCPVDRKRLATIADELEGVR
jgi:hypothetical protein